jgi:mono/diheme cytochrome c family protein
MPPVLAWLIVTVVASTVHARGDGAGRSLYTANCAACHGDDGRGGAAREAGYPVAMPDFTDCSFGTPEADTDWLATIHLGGHARGFDRRMPAFGDVLDDAKIERIVRYLRGFCGDDRWPRGDLNFPRPFLTEKAFPEDEATVSIAASRTEVTTELFYERRIGVRYQLEVVAPLIYAQQEAGGWAGGVGDVAFALKRVLVASLATGSILAASVEVAVPTGRTDRGLGEGTTKFEGSVSFGQRLPAGGFLHAQAGLGIAYDRSHSDDAFARAAIGDQIVPVRFGRMFAPMLEVMASRTLDRGSPLDVDLVPQLQVTLSARQHLRAAAGVQVPITDRADRGVAGLVYLLWDWADGGLTEGW